MPHNILALFSRRPLALATIALAVALATASCRRDSAMHTTVTFRPAKSVGANSAKGARVGQERFTFKSGGEQIVGNLFLPEARPIGLIVTSGPMTSVKEQATGAHAKAMAERGFAALAFDHRYFGESGGEPRQFEKPAAKIEDIRNAATALLADERFRDLPVFGLGVCFGAGMIVRAVAEDTRFRAMAGVAGVYTDVAKTREALGDKYQAKIDAARDAERRFESTGKAEMIPAVGPNGGNVGMPLREAYDFYGTSRGAVPNYVNGFAVQSNAYLLPFDAMGAATAMKVPVLIVHSERALLPDLAKQFHAKLGVPKKELWLQSQGQIDFYDDPKLIGASADAVAAWFAALRR